ncbi:MAG: 5'-nucleotidase C-terminal domain-containing protein [Flavobacteriaceae bacterium]
MNFSCKPDRQTLSQVRGEQLSINDSISPADSIEAFVLPYRNRVNEVLDSALAYAPYMISKTDGIYNTTAGNLLADILLQEANPIFKSRANKDIDFVVLNHGGIRSIISEGKVSARTAYEVMPFENSIVVVELSGKSVRDLVAFLIASKRAHPIAGLQIILDKDGGLQSVNIKGAPFDENRRYYVATSNYLVTGGDNMGFFKDGLSFTDTDYLIRNAMIDYFKKVDTLAPVVDDRFMKLN